MRRVVDALEARRVLRPFVVAEIGVARAGRQNEKVVSDPSILGDNLLGVEVDAVTSASMTVALAWPASMLRIGEAMSAGDRPAVATW